jgi:virulence-associated protein VapD
VLSKYDFSWVQGSIYLCNNEDLTNLFDAMDALRALPWFPASVRDIRAFRVEQWSDFTEIVKRAR